VPDAPQSILVVFDGSDVSKRALSSAIERARARNAPLTVLAVIPPRLWRAKRGQLQVPPYRHDEPFVREQIAHAKDLARREGVRVGAKIRTGPPAHVIADEAAKGYSLVIMGDRPNAAGGPTLGGMVRQQTICEVELVS
jgi:nucleotide-binding universal stress UspA family protein